MALYLCILAAGVFENDFNYVLSLHSSKAALAETKTSGNFVLADVIIELAMKEGEQTNVRKNFIHLCSKFSTTFLRLS